MLVERGPDTVYDPSTVVLYNNIVTREDRGGGGPIKPNYRGRENEMPVGEALDPEHKLLR